MRFSLSWLYPTGHDSDGDGIDDIEHRKLEGELVFVLVFLAVSYAVYRRLSEWRRRNRLAAVNQLSRSLDVLNL